MKHLIPFIFLLSFGSSFAQNKYDVTMKVDGINRNFIVVRPSGAVPAGGYPVVFMFHGTSGDGEKFYNISGWKEIGETEKIITVFPSSLAYCVDDDSGKHTTTKWNNGDLQAVACPGQTFHDDVHFTRVMLDTISKAFPVDLRRVYASGFSNGGTFTSKLSVEASDIFAALAAAAGPLHTLDSGAVKRHLPFVFSFGTDDDRFYTPIGKPSVPFNDSALAIFYNGFFSRMFKVFELAPIYTKDSNALALHYLFNTLAVTASWEFNFLLFKGLTHEYPNGINYPVTAANILWSYFKQFTLPTSEVRKSQAPETAQLWPNPAHEFITIDAEYAKHFTLISLLGEKVFEKDIYSHERLQLPNLPSQMYIAEIEATQGVIRSKLLIK